MFSQRHLKMVHGVIAIFVTLCLLITCHSLLKGEYRRIAQERQAVAERLQKVISSSVKAYEAELTEFIALLKAKKIDNLSDFNRVALSFTATSQPAIEYTFFAPYQHQQETPPQEVHQQNTSNQSTHHQSEKDTPFFEIYSVPKLANSSNAKKVITNYYEKNATILLKNKKAILSKPLTFHATTTQKPHKDGAHEDDLHDERNDFLLLLSKPVHFEEGMIKNINESVWGVIGIAFKFDDVLENMNLSDFHQILFRVADVGTIPSKSLSPDNMAMNFFYQSSLSGAEAWSSEAIHRGHIRINGREWVLDTRFRSNDSQLLNWSLVIVPVSLLLSIGFLLHLYLLRTSYAYKKALVATNKQAEIDPLTGLYSRYFIYEKLKTSLLQAKSEQSKLLVMCLDLDHFKTINDAFNHDVGDKMLIKVAQRLLSVVPDNAIVGRLGGDEFLVYFEFDNTFTQENIKSLCDEVITQVSQSYFIDNRMLTVGCSIGLVLFPESGSDAVTLVKNADMAMYKAKGAGRATYHFYDGSIGDQLARNAKVETRLRLAMQHDELQIYFQPKVDLTTLECVGLEALLRWEDHELGVVSPAEFIPIAERSGIILPLGDWVIEQSCRQISQWQEKGLKVPPIAINCSAAQLRRHDFLPKLLNSLHDFNVLPPQVELEVTESILIEDPETCSSLLRQVSNLGMKITIDDFGTGYSSLSYLRDLPFDCIKIDQAFVHDIMEDESHAALTDAIIKMGQSLKLQVVAEGITTQEQLVHLRSLGCDIGQGFLFGEAFHADQLSNHADTIEDLLTKEIK
ncbi:EAL domain-containing protein [Marinomonas agarivorans]|nr:EAL domain-containing protein [Marinomonas agarivorans]